MIINCHIKQFSSDLRVQNYVFFTFPPKENFPVCAHSTVFLTNINCEMLKNAHSNQECAFCSTLFTLKIVFC